MNATADVTAEDTRICGSAISLDRDAGVHRADRIEEARRLLDIAMDFRDDGWPDKARRFGRRALAIFERESGTDHLAIARALLCVAGARADLGDYGRAEADYWRSHDILGRLADAPDSLEAQRLRIQTIRGLANVSGALGRDRQAATMLKQALAMGLRTLGCEHPDVASVLNDFGAQYRKTGGYEDAARLHRLALAIAEAAGGGVHRQVATILHELAVLEHARGQFAAGEPLARRSVDIREKTLGPDHPQVAAACAALAALLEGQGKYDEAGSMYQRALTILEHWFGPDHRDVAMTASHLARIFGRAVDERRPKGDALCA
jgi:tetratricopeptide (TPR) repeat protein